ncbi:hypothetical protein OPV22_006270 [Ensete ventricosum]|uniref:START domain-containing protein n=1 Tax=Ensete ventricosum TaxID=4639 RepID=A0AAV8RSE3_ENSVE|nr:hypothetical protein OPV22_006270 [Ensete ventricosum]
MTTHEKSSNVEKRTRVNGGRVRSLRACSPRHRNKYVTRDPCFEVIPSEEETWTGEVHVRSVTTTSFILIRIVYPLDYWVKLFDEAAAARRRWKNPWEKATAENPL